MKNTVDLEKLCHFKNHLLKEEKSKATVEKYIRDVRSFFSFVKNKKITKKLVIDYKFELLKRYEVTSANSMLSAMNEYFGFIDRTELKVKKFRVQRDAFCSPEKELTKADYLMLIAEAEKEGNEKLALIIQTICATGIRVSELSFITVEAARKGETVVECKSKLRRIFIVEKLANLLLSYAGRMGICEGQIFLNRYGQPITRNSIWRYMKSLAKKVSLDERKVFPHNLRHLFAITFYENDKDIAKLADVLGHTSINTTRAYIISSGKEHKKQMEKMNLLP